MRRASMTMRCASSRRNSTFRNQRMSARQARRTSRARRSRTRGLQVYRDPAKYWSLYQLAEKLIDLDDAFLTWRHKHVLTVERIIGRKRGTGGTEGVGYLQQTLDPSRFPRDLVAEDEAMKSYKHLFSRALAASPRRIHFAAHSHHLWPDASYDGHIAAWDDAAILADRKWEKVFGEVIPEAQRHVAWNCGLPDPKHDRVHRQHARAGEHFHRKVEKANRSTC
jgi:hypothetical protein